MNIVAAYQLVGTYRGAADICGTTHKTVKRVIERTEAGEPRPVRAPRPANYEGVRTLVTDAVKAGKGRVSAKRLLPRARAAGYTGSDRNFRRLVAQERQRFRGEHGRGRRPAVWSPGEHLVIDWGVIAGVHVFCAVLAWSRFRFVRFAADEKQATTLAMLTECFEVLGGVPKVVLADRMGCLKGGVVANRVVPSPEYVRFATHYSLTELTGGSLQVRRGVSLLDDMAVRGHGASHGGFGSCRAAGSSGWVAARNRAAGSALRAGRPDWTGRCCGGGVLR